VQTIKILEISEHHHRLVYQLISSEPPIDVLSVVHTIRVHQASWDADSQSTVDYGFLELSTDFSSDVNRSTLEDSKWKKRDFISDLKVFLSHQGSEKKSHEKKTKVEHKTTPKTSSSSSNKPDFSGVWICVRSEGLEEFLKDQGFNERTIEALEKKQMIQVIKHTEKQFVVNSGGYLTVYVIGGLGELEGVESVLKSPMVWDGNTLVSVAQDEPASNPSTSTVMGGGGLITRREMVGKQLCLIMQTKTKTCKRYFDLIPPKNQTSQMQELAKQTFSYSTLY